MTSATDVLEAVARGMVREEPFLGELFKDDEIDALALAAITALAANVSPEMVEAFKNKLEPYTDASGFNYVAALAAAIRAGGEP